MFRNINLLQKDNSNLKLKYIYLVLISTIAAILDVVQYRYMWKIFDVVKYADTWQYVINYILIFVSIVLLITVFGYLKKISKAKFSLLTSKTGYDNMNDRLRESDVTLFKKVDSAYFSNRVKSDLETISQYYTDGILSFVLNILKIVLMLGISIIINWKITLGFVITVPVLIYVYKYFLNNMQDKAQAYQEEASKYFSNWSGQVEFLDEIVQTGDYERENNSFLNSFKNYFREFFSFTKFNQLFGLSMNGITILCQLIIILLGSYFVYKKELTIGDLLVIVAYGQEIQKISLSLIQFGEQKAKKVASQSKLNEFYDVPLVEEGNLVIDSIKSIEGNINYSFDEDKSIYKDLNISLNSGNIYGILGDNGKGKTTLIRIITGVYKENEYSRISVKINGNDLKNIDTINMRRNKIAYVSQFPKSIYGTVGDYLFNEYDIDNINFDTAKNLDALSVSVSDFIKTHLNLPFSELSGGDKTFTSIVGALKSGKEVIIMDEPTANLDDSRKEWLNYILKREKSDKIIIIISHDKNIIEIIDEKIELN
ncbi:MAG: ABC transporter ATP-binding protein/permease [Ezakiella sp.]|nr:ABC transporter ATP-binding protein/permease [Ezakiella sp.]MDD7471474.1 ABC transporter ATP-binding protein [Bacillota bacterium]MDY3923676.1 ABC transporter ATP-binding protein [Ezakiella sp.]